MSDQTNDRKFEHIRIIEEDTQTDRQKAFFDEIQLTHRALPEINLSEVDPSTTFLGKTLSFPLLISSMTGGEHETIQKINHRLAEAAEACQVAMGVGSQRVMFVHPSASASFAIRKSAPTTVLLANIGAVQLNLGFGVDECRKAIEILDADGLYLHLNPLQEAIQPEGDTDFSGLAQRIGVVAKDLNVPILVKEVGAGLSPADARLLLDQGVTYLDVAGRGGTSWSRIEHHRNGGKSNPGILFQDWGIPTPLALQQLSAMDPAPRLIASGGVRNGLDMIKSCLLGAELCGLASPFLKPAMDSTEAVIEVIETLKREFTTAMFLLGIKSVNELTGNRSAIMSYGSMSLRG